MQRKGAQIEFGAQIAGHHVDERGVAAVRVVEHEFFESGAGNAGAKIAQNGHERGGAHRERAGETDMLVAFAVVNGRQRVDGQIRPEVFAARGPAADY